MLLSHSSNSRKSFIYSLFNLVILFGRDFMGDIPEISIMKPFIHFLSANLDFLRKFCITCAAIISNISW
jgi:hypothetical protein